MSHNDSDGPGAMAAPIGNRQKYIPPVLIVGYGNGLRGDDGAGCAIAEEIEGWRRPGVRVLTVPQLYPEIASELSTAQRVIFIDAEEATSDDARVQTRQLNAREESLPLGHALSPEGVIGLVREVFGNEVEAWIVTIPAFEFGWREHLSERTASFLPDALKAVEDILHA